MITAKFFLQSFYLARFTPFSLEHFQLNIIYSTPPPTSTLHPTPPHPLHLLSTPPHSTPYIYSPPHPTPPPTSTLHPTSLHPLHLLSTPPHSTPYIYSPPHPTPPPTSTLHPTSLHPLHLLSTPPHPTPYIYSPLHPTPPPTSTLHPTPGDSVLASTQQTPPRPASTSLTTVRPMCVLWRTRSSWTRFCRSGSGSPISRSSYSTPASLVSATTTCMRWVGWGQDQRLAGP